MRKLVFLLLASTLTGCSGMMMSGSSGSGGTAATQRTTQMQSARDAQLAEHVRQLFARDAVLREAGLAVSARNGIVRISGSVPSYGAREQAEKLAISTDGVSSVENRITVDALN